MKPGLLSLALPVVALTVSAACGGDPSTQTTEGTGGDGGQTHHGGGGGSDNTGGNGGHGGDGGGGAGGAGPGGTGGVGAGGHVDLTPPDAGIPDCAPMFIDADAVCRPALSKCPAGQIPKMDTGCVAVGIADCAPVFLQADGLCHPSMDACAVDEFAVPSEGCVSIDGAGCGTDPFGLVVEQNGDQHVDPTYAGGASDGSRAAPWITIGSALAHAATGARVVLAAGTYPEPIAPAHAVTVVGRCPSMVTVSGVTGAPTPSIVQVKATGGDVTIEGLTLSGNGEGVYTDGGTVHLDGVVVDGAKSTGLDLLNGATATLHHVLVRATQTTTPQSGGGGIEAQGSTITIAQSAFVDLHGRGVDTSNDGALTVEDSLFQGVKHLTGNSPKGDAINAGIGVTVQASGIAVTECDGVPFAASDTKASLLSDSFFDLPATQFAFAGVVVVAGFSVPLDATLTVDGLVVAGGQSYGISVDGTGVVVSRTLVKDVVAEGGGAFGVQDGAGDGGKLVLSDSAATNNGVGLVVSITHKTSTLTHVVFDSNVELNDTTRATGLALFDGSVNLDRIAVLASPIAGASFDYGSVVKLSKSIISSTTPGTVGNLLGKGGSGLVISDKNTSVTLDGVRIESSHAAGVFVSYANVKIANVLVSGVAQGTLYDPVTFASANDVAYGIAVDQAPAPGVSISDSWITGAAGASIVFAKAPGSIHSTHAEGGLYGLAVQGMPTPTFGSDDELSGTTQDVLTNGMLPLP